MRKAKSTKWVTQGGQKIDDDFLRKNAGKALSVLKFPMPVKQHFILLAPGDVLISPNGREQTAGAMSAVAIRQSNGNWNMVQLTPRGYVISNEHPHEMTSIRHSDKTR